MRVSVVGPMKVWLGHTLYVDGIKRGEVRRSHGNWLALTYFKNGTMQAGEYFAYGEPGAITRAKAFCELWVQKKHRRRG